jgi:type VI secretion system protein ImpH
MAAKKRKQNTSITDRLFAEPQSFSFFKAVRLLEELNPGKEKLGVTLEPGKEPVKFSVKPGFAFPPCEIDSIEDKEGGPPVMSVAFMGMIGPSGVMPYWFNELALNRNREKDFSLTSFLDIFHHRLITLFYLAWKRSRFAENYSEDHTDRLSAMLLSLSGLGTRWLLEMSGLPAERFLFYTGQLSRPAPSAATLTAVISSMTGTDVSLDQFRERSIKLTPEDMTSLGTANAALGVDTVVGSEVTDMQTGFRVNIGSMGYDEYLKFLPGGDMAEPVKAMVRFSAGIEYEYDLRIILKKEEVPALGLGMGYHIGETTWLVQSEGGADIDKYIIIREKA